MNVKIQSRGWVHAYPTVNSKEDRASAVERIEPISPITPVNMDKPVKTNEQSLGERIILSDVAECFIKVFVFGIAPLYVLYLIYQFFMMMLFI